MRHCAMWTDATTCSTRTSNRLTTPLEIQAMLCRRTENPGLLLDLQAVRDAVQAANAPNTLTPSALCNTLNNVCKTAQICEDIRDVHRYQPPSIAYARWMQ